MENNLEIIMEKPILGREFKIYGTAEEPLFLAKDVAAWIEHSNQRMMIKSIDEEEKVRVNNAYAVQGQQEQWFLKEDGLYEVLMQSRKPIAKMFKKEVKTILKEIRKNGMYVNQNLLNNMLEKENQKQQAKVIEDQKPKVIFADAVKTSSTTILVGELAKLIKVEIQLINQYNMIKRTIFYLSKMILKQLKKGDNYNELNKTIIINYING